MHFQVALGVCSQSVLAHARNLHFTSPEGEGFQPSPKETLKNHARRTHARPARFSQRKDGAGLQGAAKTALARWLWPRYRASSGRSYFEHAAYAAGKSYSARFDYPRP